MQPILIGLHGVKRAGKDTTADFITRFAAESDPALAVVRRGFADKGKWAFARQFFPDITLEDAIEWVDAYKEHPRAGFEIPAFPLNEEDGDYEIDWCPFRQALAQFCTEGARDIYGDDFWVDQLLPTGKRFDMHDLPIYPIWHESFESHHLWDGPAPADLCLIRDVRFPNEVERIKMLGGKCWKIKRKDAEDRVIAEAEAQGREIHASELGLDDKLFDEIIDNSDNNMNFARMRTYEAMSRLLTDDGC